MTNKVLLTAVLGFALFAQWHLRASALTHKVETDVYEHVFYVPPPDALAVLSLGHREALADLLWARGLVYLGEELIRNLDADHVLSYGRAVVSLDPYFARAYGAFALSVQSRPGHDKAEALARLRDAIAFMEEGMRYLPEDGELAWNLGGLYAYSLAPQVKTVAEYRAAKDKGVEYLRTAVLHGAGPTWAGLANASTLVRLGQTEQAIAHLQELYAITSDPDVLRQIELQLAHLRSTAFAEGIKHASSELSALHKRDFPYVSETMYLLLGPRGVTTRDKYLQAHFDPAFMKHSDTDAAAP